MEISERAAQEIFKKLDKISESNTKEHSEITNNISTMIERTKNLSNDCDENKESIKVIENKVSTIDEKHTKRVDKLLYTIVSISIGMLFILVRTILTMVK